MDDLIIIGAGPAGLAASIYASRYKIKHVVIGKEVGGTALKAFKVENYPGFESITGLELMQRFQKQALALGAKIRAEEAVSAKKIDKGFEITVHSGEKCVAKSVILALGTHIRKLGVPGEKELEGQGVSYCATCDAAFFRNKKVAVVGGNNSAATSALLLSDYADKVYLIYRKDKLRAEPIWTKSLEDNNKIEIIYNTNVTEIKGEGLVRSVMLDTEYNGSNEIALDGVFVAIGSMPAISLANDLGVETDDKGCIRITPACATNVPGVFAAGDVTSGSDHWRQIVTAASEGALAARGAYNYIRQEEK